VVNGTVLGSCGSVCASEFCIESSRRPDSTIVRFCQPVLCLRIPTVIVIPVKLLRCCRQDGSKGKDFRAGSLSRRFASNFKVWQCHKRPRLRPDSLYVARGRLGSRFDSVSNGQSASLYQISQLVGYTQELLILE